MLRSTFVADKESNNKCLRGTTRYQLRLPFIFVVITIAHSITYFACFYTLLFSTPPLSWFTGIANFITESNQIISYFNIANWCIVNLTIFVGAGWKIYNPGVIKSDFRENGPAGKAKNVFPGVYAWGQNTVFHLQATPFIAKTTYQVMGSETLFYKSWVGVYKEKVFKENSKFWAFISSSPDFYTNTQTSIPIFRRSYFIV